eukprot:maker-scaffold336_size202805-snap-gene-1.48 protein:Tk02923 transcript:maker-scaffold336_size202805-snap-gene-1.48-mRNA-1 annotation:"hypothetical protein TcasGA2_TC001173"
MASECNPALSDKDSRRPAAASPSLVQDFEAGFASILGALTHEDAGKSGQDAPRLTGEALKQDQEEKMVHFMDLARDLEAFFLQKRMLLHAHKPELILREECTDMKQEMAKKDELIRRHYEKLGQWQALLQDMQGTSGPGASQGAGPPGLGQPGPGAPGSVAASSLTRTANPLHGPTGPGAPIQPGVGAPQGGFVPGNNYRMQAPMGSNGDHLSYLEKTTTNVGGPPMSR